MSRPSERAVNRPAFSHVSQGTVIFWEECEGVHRVFYEVHTTIDVGTAIFDASRRVEGFQSSRPERSTKSISSRIIRGGNGRQDGLHGVIQWIIVKANEILVDVTVLQCREAFAPHILTGINAHHEHREDKVLTNVVEEARTSIRK